MECAFSLFSLISSFSKPLCDSGGSILYFLPFYVVLGLMFAFRAETRFSFVPSRSAFQSQMIVVWRGLTVWGVWVCVLECGGSIPLEFMGMFAWFFDSPGLFGEVTSTLLRWREGWCWGLLCYLLLTQSAPLSSLDETFCVTHGVAALLDFGLPMPF